MNLVLASLIVWLALELLGRLPNWLVRLDRWHLKRKYAPEIAANNARRALLQSQLDDLRRTNGGKQ